MSGFAQDFDDLDRLIDNGAAKDAVRSQARFIQREVAALEADYARLAQQHSQLQAAQVQSSSPLFEFRRGLWWQAGDEIPFCPQCWEANSKRIHMVSTRMMSEKVECWDCRTCNSRYTAKEGENFSGRARIRRGGAM